MPTLREAAFGFNPAEKRDPFGKWLHVGAEVAHAPDGSPSLRPAVGKVTAIHKEDGRTLATVEWKARGGRPATKSKIGAHDLVPKAEVDKPL